MWEKVDMASFKKSLGNCLGNWENRGMQWRSWLRHCATSRNVPGRYDFSLT